MQKPFRTLLLCLATLAFACNTGTSMPKDRGTPEDIPKTWHGAWYERPSDKPIGCKMVIEPGVHGVFVGPIPGSPTMEHLGTFTAKGDQLFFTGDSLELVFTHQADSSLAYSGDINSLKGLVMDHN